METRIEKKKLATDLTNVHAGEPFATFEINERNGEFPYCAAVLAYVPSQVREFTVVGPSDKHPVKTPAGEIQVRTLKVKWTDEITPNTTPCDLWQIVVWYNTKNPADKDGAVEVVYEYGNPKTTRGTVTTTGNIT
ncbi:MAG: hypothetical protein AAGC45_05600 [Bacteroidota bacterium]